MRKLRLTGFSSLLSISDEQAMWRVQNQDDHKAFALLVERWEERIWRLCTRMVGNPHSAEDLAQEAFVRSSALCGFPTILVHRRQMRSSHRSTKRAKAL